VFCYVGAGWYAPGKTIRDLQDEMRGHLDAGYTMVKMKVGGMPLADDLKRVEAVKSIVPRGGKLIWMDSTAEIAPVGVLVGPLRDKQALAIPATRAAYLERTPADLPFPQMMRFQADGKLSDKGVFTGHVEQSYRGDIELIMRSAFRQVPQSQWKPFVQRFSNSIGFGGEVKEPEVSAVEKTSEPFHLAYDYTREKYSEWDDHRINPPMPAVGWESMPGVKQIKPVDDIEIGSPGEQVYATSIKLPDGWHLFPPNGVDLKEDWAEYHSKYSFANGTFSAERRLVFKQGKVPLADWDKYLKFREAIYAAKQQKSMSLASRAEATYAEYRRQKASGSGGRGFRLPL